MNSGSQEICDHEFACIGCAINMEDVWHIEENEYGELVIYTGIYPDD